MVLVQLHSNLATGTEQMRKDCLSPLLSLPAEAKEEENCGACWQPSIEIRQKSCAITGTWRWSGSGDLCRTELPWLIIQNYFPVGASSVSCVWVLSRTTAEQVQTVKQSSRSSNAFSLWVHAALNSQKMLKMAKPIWLSCLKVQRSSHA